MRYRTVDAAGNRPRTGHKIEELVAFVFRDSATGGEGIPSIGLPGEEWATTMIAADAEREAQLRGFLPEAIRRYGPCTVRRFRAVSVEEVNG